MKKFIALLFSMVLICTVQCAMADEGSTIYIDYNKVEFTEDTGIPYTNEAYRTMVPVRKPMEMLGAKVDWDEETQTVILTKDSSKIKVSVDSSHIIKDDGTVIYMDTTSAKLNDRVYLPIRPVAEALGATVLWNEQLNTIYIMSDEYQQFRDSFAYDGQLSNYSNAIVVSAFYKGDMTEEEFAKYWGSFTDEETDIIFKAIATEKQALNPDYEIFINFYYTTDNDNTRDPHLGNVSSYSFDTRRYNPFDKKTINELD